MMTIKGHLLSSTAIKHFQTENIVTFSALTMLVGWQEGHPACKKLGVGLLVVMIWLELCMAYSSNCHHRFHHPLLQWTPGTDNPGSPGKWPLKQRERDRKYRSPSQGLRLPFLLEFRNHMCDYKNRNGGYKAEKNFWWYLHPFRCNTGVWRTNSQPCCDVATRYLSKNHLLALSPAICLITMKFSV